MARLTQGVPLRCSTLLYVCARASQRPVPGQRAPDLVSASAVERRGAVESRLPITSLSSHASCLERSGQGQSTALAGCGDEG